MTYNPAAGGITAAQAIAAVEDEATLDLDGGRVGIGGVADGAEKLKVSGNIVVTGLVDGVDIATRDHAKYTNAEAVAAVGLAAHTATAGAHHAKYTNAEAITAVEGEGTLALTGAVTNAGTVTNNAAVTNAHAFTQKRVAIAVGASPYTVLASDCYIGVNSAGGAVELDLPAAATGRILHIKDEGAAAATNNITIDPNTTEQIDSGGAGTALVMSTNKASFSLYGLTGTGWFIF